MAKPNLLITLSSFLYQAAGCVCKLSSTIVAIDDLQSMRMTKALNRTEHVASETPQAFQWELIYQAYEKVETVM